ncbi:NAD(P)H-binding protein [Streptomyces sp. ADMS]|uniref:NAD(P)H-binding protein n=1 Tax=Streptomyces sp. ADMS TaxID=3071415 RepID=UPI00296F195C|nr:NAD(P)H-binding protein [Streptomyces sp. ADMS]MDW4909081.1 NAD(P)H-binding protein [Streptomyces sp. ADMS]
MRNPAALDDLAGQVTLHTGDATSPHDVSAAVAGQDAVVPALGVGTSLRANDLFEAQSGRHHGRRPVGSCCGAVDAEAVGGGGLTTLSVDGRFP